MSSEMLQVGFCVGATSEPKAAKPKAKSRARARITTNKRCLRLQRHWFGPLVHALPLCSSQALSQSTPALDAGPWAPRQSLASNVRVAFCHSNFNSLPQLS